jgi:uncharacterized membrane protein
MEKDKNKALEAFYKEIIQEAGLEEPSANFTTSVISKIQKDDQKAEIFSYRPLIPRYIWWVSAVLLGIFFGYTFLEPENLGFVNLPKWNLDFFNMSGFIDVLNNFKLPDALVYGSLSLAIFISLQAYLLKTHWNKRFIIE